VETREQVTVTGDFTIAAWQAEGGQDACWDSLRADAARTAAGRDRVLADGPETRHVLFMRTVLDDGWQPKTAECAAEEAGFVRLRLECFGRRISDRRD